MKAVVIVILAVAVGAVAFFALRRLILVRAEDISCRD